jgi:hypothetical protein
MNDDRYTSNRPYHTIALLMVFLTVSLFVLDPLATAIEHATDATPNVFLMAARLFQH